MLIATHSTLSDALRAALDSRGELLARLSDEGTDCVRLFHGAVEGRPGLTVDRYGPLVLVQTFRDPLEDGELERIHVAAEAAVGAALELVWNHRGERGKPDFDQWHGPAPAALVDMECREADLRYRVRARHRGIDPLLFLDFRAGRRLVRGLSDGARVCNLFAYTCGIGLAAAAGGARTVLNVDFAESALRVGQDNAALNQLSARQRFAQADVLPTIRQLAGLPVRGKGARRAYTRFPAEEFDLVVLDPPTWARSRFGAVDPVRDYPSLLKPCLLMAAPGGKVLATNHVSTVDVDEWHGGLRRCAAKAGRPVQQLDRVAPDADFPSPDDRPPLKMALLHL